MNLRFPNLFKFVVVSCGLLSSLSRAAPGDLDPTFGSEGRVLTDLNSGTGPGASSEGIDDMVLQPDGKIVATGSISCGASDGFGVVRYNPDGTLDPTFGIGGKVTTPISISSSSLAVALQTDGKIVLAGSSWDGTRNDFTIARYLPSGALDQSFGNAGTVITPIGSRGAIANCVLIQPDGKIVAAGFVIDPSGPGSNFVVVRYQSDGKLDTTFGADGMVSTRFGSSYDEARGIVLQPDGKIVAAGSTSVVDDFGHNIAIVRYTAEGTLDSAFHDDGKLTIDLEDSSLATDVVLQPDGKIVLAGTSNNVISGKGPMLIARLQEDGRLDSSFATGGIALPLIGNESSIALGIAVQTDGKIVTAGSARVENISNVAAVRLQANGTLDSLFGSGGKVSVSISDSFNSANAVLVQSDGKIIAGGNAVFGESPRDIAMVRLTSGGTVDVDFGRDGIVRTAFGGSVDEPYAIALGDDDRIVVVGSANDGSAWQDFGVAMYHPNGAPDTRFGGDGTVVTDLQEHQDYATAADMQTDGKVIVAGFSRSRTTGFDYALARYNPDGSLDQSFGTGGKVITPLASGPSGDRDFLQAVRVDSEGKIIAAGTSADDFSLARYLPDGSLDQTFSDDGKLILGNFGYEGRSLAIQKDGKILLAGYERLEGFDSDFALVRLLPDGSLDQSFDEDGMLTTSFGPSTDRCFAMALQRDGKILLGGFHWTGTEREFALARYLSDGALDPTFGMDGRVITGIQPGSDDTIKYIGVQADGKIVATGMADLNNLQNAAIVRYKSDGSLDSSFGDNGIVTSFLAPVVDLGAGVAAALQSNGAIVMTTAGRGGCDLDFLMTRFEGDPPAPGIAVEQPVGRKITSGESSIIFGRVLRYAELAQSAVVISTGTVDLSVSAVSLEGADASSFAISSGALPGILPPGEDAVFFVTFSPTRTGPHSATLRISNNDELENDFTVALSGFGTGPPDFNAGPTGALQTLELAEFIPLTDLSGVLTWSLKSIENSDIFDSVTLDPATGFLSIDYAPFISGSSELIAMVMDGDQNTAQFRFTAVLPELPTPTLVVSAPPVLNIQTGLFEQRITATTIAQRSIGGLVVTIAGIPPEACLYNASSCTADTASVSYLRPLAPGESVTLLLEYYHPTRGEIPTPEFTIKVALPEPLQISGNPGLVVDRVERMENRAVLVEFPGTPGKRYLVQYSDDMIVWYDSLVPVTAAGTRVQWIDQGPPRTHLHPSEVTARYYRVLEADEQ